MTMTNVMIPCRNLELELDSMMNLLDTLNTRVRFISEVLYKITKDEQLSVMVED